MALFGILCELPPDLQAVRPMEADLLEGSLRVISDGQEIAEQFSPQRDMTFEVEAEYGQMGLRFTEEYKGMKIEVDAILNQEKEDFELERAVHLCVHAHLACCTTSTAFIRGSSLTWVDSCSSTRCALCAVMLQVGPMMCSYNL